VTSVQRAQAPQGGRFFTGITTVQWYSHIPNNNKFAYSFPNFCLIDFLSL